MNRIYRLIWNARHGAYEPSAETARGRRKRSGGRRSLLVGSLVAGTLTATAQAAPQLTAVAPTALPTAPTVTTGQASVTTKGSQMTVTESTTKAAINWGSFDIGSAAGVTFVQPTNTSVVLNRSLSADPSQIYGKLSANGYVFIVNPQGVVVGNGAEVNVGGFVASSLNLSNQDLLGGHYTFTGSNSSGAVSNAGNINVAAGGFAALIGPQVSNTGAISARLGSVALASGKQATLDFDDTGMVKVAVDQAALNAMVQNSGAIVADGGRIVLTAKSANDVLGSVVNNTGVLQSQSLGMKSGQIWLLASDPVANTGANGSAANANAVQGAAGGVISSGTIDVSGTGGSAGQVTLAGTTVDVAGTIKAGNTAGNAGRALINSTQSSTLEVGSTIDVSSAGAAGKVVVWSDGDTNAAGSIQGHGVGASGAGATVEVSAARDLAFNAAVQVSADESARSGTLILDPATLEIAAGSGSGSSNIVYQSTLQSQSGNIVLSATGQITVDALNSNVLNLANASGLSITSESSGGITFLNNGSGTPSGITTHGAPVTLTASGSGSLDNVGTITTQGGDISLSGVYVHLAGGLDATNGQNAAGGVAVSVFGGGLLSSSTSPIAGAQVLLDGTYGYVGASGASIPTATPNLTVKTGGNAFVSDADALTSLSFSSNHLEGTPVSVGITAPNLTLTGADGAGDGTTYSGGVRWTQYSASNPSASLTGPTTVSITEDGNLLPGNINLPQTALNLTSSQEYILGGNTQPVTANTLILSSPMGIGGTDFYGINGETDGDNPGAAGGATLLINAGTVTANVISPSGSITGIANLTQQGNLVGSVQAQDVLLQATGNIGSNSQNFALTLADGGEAFNIAAGGNINLAAEFPNSATFENVQASGSLSVQATTANGWDGSGATFGQVSAGSDLTLTGVQNPWLTVNQATSTNGSIVISNDYNLEVYGATLLGTDAPSRSIWLNSNQGEIVFGSLSTNGPSSSTASAAPLGTISITAPESDIYDLSYWNGDGQEGVLRGGNVTLSALYDIELYQTAVDTHANLSMIGGTPGSDDGYIYATLWGIDSLTDPAGTAAHSIHIVNATTYEGDTEIYSNNGGLRIGLVRAYYDYGGGDSDSGYIDLYATGSIVPDGSVGGGRISASDLNGNGGEVYIEAGGSLGQRGTGAGGNTGAGYLSLSGSDLELTSGGDLFVQNDQDDIYLRLSLNYASNPSSLFYHLASGSAASVQAGTPSIAFNGSSSGGLLTETTGGMNDDGNSFQLNLDGSLRIESFQAGQSSSLTINTSSESGAAGDVIIDAPSNNTAALSLTDYTNLQINAAGGLNIGNLASIGSSAGNNSVNLNASGGNVVIGKLDAPLANVNLNASGGDIVAAGVGNQLLAGNLSVANSFGAIGADPAASGSVPINIGVSGALSLNNVGSGQSGGGSINLVTLNDPTSLNLDLYIPNSGSYAGAHFSIAPVTTGLGLSGSADSTGVTLATLGTTGSNPAAVPVNITANTPSITIDSGAGPQLGIGYTLSFGTSYPSVVANLSGSAGQNVVLDVNNANGSAKTITGALSLTNLVVNDLSYSGNSPLDLNFTLGQALSAFQLVRSGNDNDPASFNGGSVTLAGSGQTITTLESTGSHGAAPSALTVNANSTSALNLEVDLQESGSINVGTIAVGAGDVTLSAHSNVGSGGGGFTPYSTAILGTNSSNSITASSVSLSATNGNAGQATIGTSATPININASAANFTTSGNLYAATGSALGDLSITASHPNWRNAANSNTYTITGSTALSASDTAASFTTTLASMSSSSPVDFSFTTDAALATGTINAGSSGSVSLTSTGSFNGGGNYPAIGISRSSGTITAGTVDLTSTGYQGYVGVSGTAMSVAAPNLEVTSDGNVYVADSASLNSLSLALGHSNSYTLGYVPNNAYSITASNISALSIIDNNNNGNCCSPNIQLANLVSTTLQSFSLTTTDTNLVVGTYDGTPFSGQVNLSGSATVSLTSRNNIWAAGGGGAPGLSDQASGAVADDTVAIKTGTLDLNAQNGSVAFSWNTGGGQQQTAIPIEVTNLAVNASGGAYITNVGTLNVTSATLGGSGYFRAVEPSAGTEASVTGGSQAHPISASDLTLVAMYGDIGSGSNAAITNTTHLTLQAGADINAVSESALTNLSILSDHHKGAVSDTSNGGLNSVSVTDQGAIPLQLGVTDLGVGGGGYQLNGMNSPGLALGFETDTSISVGALTAQSIALQSDSGSILHIPSGGTITADSVGLTAATAGQSVGAAGQNILVNSPSLVVYTGGNMYVADSATLDSFGLIIGAVGDLGSTPVYHLDNSAAAAPLAFNVSADLAGNTLDLNSITASRTDAPVSIDVHSYNSSVAAGTITSNQGTVSLVSNSGSVYGLGGPGISASEVDLSAYGGNVGADQSGNSAPVVLAAGTVYALTDGALQITSSHTIDSLSVTQYNGGLANGTAWSVVTPDFNLTGAANSSHEIDLTSVTGATTDLSVSSTTDILVGTLSLGSANLNLSAYNNSGISITGDGTSGSNPNITTTGNVTLGAGTGVGTSGTAVTTNIGGELSVSTQGGLINIDQISTTPLVVSNLSTGVGDTGTVHVVGQGDLDFTGGFGVGGGTTVTLTAAGDVNFAGIGMNGGTLNISAGGSIDGGDMSNVTTATLTAAGTATGSPGTLTVGNIDGVWWMAGSGAMQLTALGDINLNGDIESTDSVSVTSTGGSIYGHGGNGFGITPTLTLSAAGDIGNGSAGSVGAWVLNGAYNESPSSLALSASGGGAVNLTSYAPVVASTLHGGGDVGLYVIGTVWTSGADLQFGSVSSTTGVVTLNTYGGNITAINGSSSITAGTGINLIAQENPYIFGTGTATDAVYSLGTSGTPLQLSAPQIALTANGDIYATLPSTGVTDLSVARTYVSNTNVSQTADMPSSTVAIGDGTSTDVLDVADGGWSAGGQSVINANYGTALNLSYAGNNAIELGTIDLNGGSLALQATSPSDVSITSSGGLIQANELSFNLHAIGTATGGFGTAAHPINTEIGSLSGSTVGATAGVFMDQTGGITLASLNTGGDISIMTARVSGPTANADITIGNVNSGGSVHLSADGAIDLASNVSSPNITANGGSSDGDVSLTAAAGIDLPGMNIGSNHSNITLTATAGDIDLSGTTNANLSAAGNLNIDAQAGGVSIVNGQLGASGSLTIHAGATGLDVSGGTLNAAGPIQLTADQGDIGVGYVYSYGGAGSVTLTATTGAIDGTLPTQLNTNPTNSIDSRGNITLIAATGIGTAALPITTVEYNGGTTSATTTGAGDINLVTGYSGAGGATLDVNSGGALTVQNYYQNLTLDNVQSVNDMHVTEENYYGQLILNNVAATGPGAVIAVVAPYGDISSQNTSGVVSASRIVLNALGDSSGGTLGQSGSPVNVDSDVAIAVASGNISLNSVATGVSKMPLVASNGLEPTISITSAGDFQVGQIVAGQEGEVDINSVGNIYDDGDGTTRIYAGTVNLTATGAIGTSVTPLQLSAVNYDSSGATVQGNVSAASTSAGNIYLAQQGDVDLVSLTTANGSINVSVQGQSQGMSTLTLADSSATDVSGNDVNILMTQGDLTVDQAIAGMTAGTVDINAQVGSIYGDGRSNCCTVPNASANTVTLYAAHNVGSVTDLATLAGVAFGIEANHSDVITSAATGSQINLQYVGNAEVGTPASSAPNIVNPLGLNPTVVLQACGTLTVDGLNLGGAAVGLNAGTAGSGGSVVDGINGGASQSQPDVNAASLVVGAADSVGGSTTPLWVNASSISANATNGGVWINSAAATPVTLPVITAGNGPVVINGLGNLLLGSVNAGSSDVTLSSANGAIQDGISGGSSSSQPNVVGGTLTVNSATNTGGSSDALWVNVATINADATNGGVWFNSAATTPVTLASITAGNGAVGITGQGDLTVESVTAANSPVSITGQGNVLVESVDAGTGAVTLTSSTAAVQDGISGGSSSSQPNVVGGAVTVNSATNAGDSSDALWVNASTINADATGGGVWINGAGTNPVTLGSVVAGNGPVVITGQGNVLVGSINAGTSDVTLTSVVGAVQDGVSGGSSSSHPNVVGGTFNVSSATNAGGSNDALWVNAATINADATNGGVWINSAATTPVTLASITAGNGAVGIGALGALTVESVTSVNSPISIIGQGNVLVDTVNAGTGAVTLGSTAGAVQDGISGGSSSSQPNVVGGTVTVNSGTDSGNSSDALWVNASTINADANNGGVWINSAATTSVTLGSIVTGNGPVVITGQSDLLVDSVNAGAGTVTLSSVAGAVQDGVSGGSSSSHPNVVAGAINVSSATNAGGSSDALWVNAATINADATNGGVWINSAATTPVTLASITAGNGAVGISALGALTVESVTSVNSPISIIGQGNVLVDTVNAGTGAVTLGSTAGAVQDGISGGSGSSQPNVVGGTVTVNSGTDSGNSSDALWVNASTINADANSGGVWINSAGTTAVTVGSVVAGHGPVVINAQGDMLVDSINAGTSAVQLVSANGGVLDGTGVASASNPNIISGALSVNSGSDAGNASDALWVNSTSISAAANTGGIWINSASTKTVTLASLLTNGGAIVVNGQGDLKLVSINAATGDVTLTSISGSLLDGIKGGATVDNPNVVGANVTLTAAKAIGNIADPIWVQGVYTFTAGTGHWINVPPVLTPYQWLPLVQGVSPVTVYAANSQAQRQSPQDLPITLIGQPAPQANPIDVSVNSLGIELPDGVAPYAVEQDSTQGTSSQPILGGNDSELGRKHSLAKTKKKGVRQSKRNSDQPNSRQG